MLPMKKKSGFTQTLVLALVGAGVVLSQRPDIRQKLEKKVRSLLGTESAGSNLIEEKRPRKSTIDTDDLVDETSLESFPASDPPATW